MREEGLDPCGGAVVRCGGGSADRLSERCRKRGYRIERRKQGADAAEAAFRLRTYRLDRVRELFKACRLHAIALGGIVDQAHEQRRCLPAATRHFGQDLRLFQDTLRQFQRLFGGALEGERSLDDPASDDVRDRGEALRRGRGLRHALPHPGQFAAQLGHLLHGCPDSVIEVRRKRCPLLLVVRMPAAVSQHGKWRREQRNQCRDKPSDRPEEAERIGRRRDAAAESRGCPVDRRGELREHNRRRGCGRGSLLAPQQPIHTFPERDDGVA